MNKYKMENKDININIIKANTWNPNEMDQKTYKAEKESIQTYGIVSPIVVRPLKNEYQIIDGEHRYKVCKDLSFKEIPCVIVNNLDDNDAKKLTIILNETKGNNNKIELGKLLGELESYFGDDLNIGLPFSNGDLKDLIEFGSVEWDKYENDAVEKESDEDIYRLHLTFKGNDIALVKEKLSENPEQTILDLLKN